MATTRLEQARTQTRRRSVLLVLPALWIAAVPRGGPPLPRVTTPSQPAAVVAPPQSARPAPQVVSVWFNGRLRQALEAMELNIRDFHAAQPNYRVQMTIVPEGAYHSAIRAAGLSGDLPCLLLLDGPMVPYFAWLGYLQPIDRFVSKGLADDILPSVIAQGTYRGRLYALGVHDSGLAIYGNLRYLKAAGVRIPVVERPWSLTEFEAALAKLDDLPGVEPALDMKINYGRGEFYTYAFAPILQSFGGDLIARPALQSARGVLDGPKSVAAMTRFQSWLRKGWVNPRPTDDNDFVSRKAALSWVGHWTYRSYAEALGSDLVLLPMPDFGHGPRTGMGAWTFAVCNSCRNPSGAGALLTFILRPEKIVRWTNLHPGVPARKSALAKSPLYRPGGPLHLYLQQIERGWAVARPRTPAYPVITEAFAEAADDIIKGADVQAALTKAAEKVDQDIRAHQGYSKP